MLKFPKDFMWGSSMSALQSEGEGTTPRSKSEFQLTFDQKPSAFFSQASPAMGVDSMNHFKEDLSLMAEFGHNSFRNGFSWSRLFPDGKTLNKEAAAYYHEFLKKAGEKGLKRIMTLVHFDLPGFVGKNGYLEPTYPERFKKYADFIFAEYGNEVEVFATYNEPHAQIVKGYLVGYVWPFKKGLQPYIDAACSIAYSHALAVNLFNAKYRKKCKAKISYVHVVVPHVPKDETEFEEEDQLAADEMNLLNSYLMLDLMVLGRVPPEFKSLQKRHAGLKLRLSAAELKEISKIRLDCMGINYYFVARVSKPTIGSNYGFDPIRSQYTWAKARFNPYRGWEVRPEGLLWIGSMMTERYGNIPFWIAENGIAIQEEWRHSDTSGTIMDYYRIAFVSEHLAFLHKAIKNGANCIGYHMWSTYDCWSMLNGYKNTYGFFRVDLNTMRRFPKKSAFWLREVKKNNGISEKFAKLEDTIDMKRVDAIPSVHPGFTQDAGKKV